MQKTEAPLHERFNSCRPMTELFVEADAELPWLGGWVLTFDSERTLDRLELCTERNGATLHCDTGPGTIALRWDWGRGAVEIESHPERREASESER